METATRLNFAKEAARGMRYLASQGVIHRDLAARNCLLTERGRLKIGDFGLSNNGKFGDKAAGADFARQHWPIQWMAPETLVLTDPDFTVSSDVYSYGVLLWEIFSSGEKPWRDTPLGRVARYVRRGDHLPIERKWVLADLMSRCWRLEPSRRPDFDDIFSQIERLVVCRASDDTESGQLVDEQTISDDDDDEDSSEEAAVERMLAAPGVSQGELLHLRRARSSSAASSTATGESTTKNTDQRDDTQSSD